MNTSPVTIRYFLGEIEKDDFILEIASLVLVEVPLTKISLTSKGAILFGQKNSDLDTTNLVEL